MKRVVVCCLLASILGLAEAAAGELPTLKDERTSLCARDPDGRAVYLQCDEQARRCLFAPAFVTTSEGQPGTIRPPDVGECDPNHPNAWTERQSAGFAMVPARHASSFGFRRDGRGRLMQTHFDLRRRYWVGVHWQPLLNLQTRAIDSAATFEVGGIVETYDEYESRRSRFRFLEGTLRLGELETHGLAFGYDLGRTSERAPIRLTTFFGAPRRHDINIDIGPGLRLGRFWFGSVDETQLGLVDLVQGHLNWEMFQSGSLEDYVLLRVGGGLGLRFYTDESPAAFYLYPEAALEWAWLAGERGLTQMRLAAKGRVGWEPASSVRWFEASASTSLERVLIAINDQPLAVFAEPSAHWLDLPGGSVADVRFMVGGRLSLFAPPREQDDLCPMEPEDYDGFQDEDGCPDPDNDSDGVEDLRDACPQQAEDSPGSEADGCPGS